MPSQRCKGTRINMLVIKEIIGSGAMGNVYRVLDELKNEEYALKELDPINPDPKDKDRFEREAMILARLNHPNLPKVHTYFNDGGRYYLVMDLINSDNLLKLLKRFPAGLPEELLRKIFSTVLDVMDYLHSQKPQPIIFRDTKPENILIAGGKVFLVDFGIAVFGQGVPFSKTSSGQKQCGTTALGTPGYAAPEQVLGANVLTDIFNIGATMYHLATGEEPKHDQPLRDIGAIRQDLSPTFVDTINRMTRWDPRDRPQTIQEIQTKLNMHGFASMRLLRTDGADIASFILTDKGKHGFNEELLPHYTQLEEYTSNELFEDAIRKIEEILKILWTSRIIPGFFIIKLFSKDDEDEKERVHQHRVFLMHCKINTLLKLKSPQKNKAAIVGMLQKSKDLNENYLLAEFYDAVGNLEDAKNIYKQIAEKYPQEKAAFKELKNIENKITARKQQKRKPPRKAGRIFQQLKQNVPTNRLSIKQKIVQWWHDQIHNIHNLLWNAQYSERVLNISFLLGFVIGNLLQWDMLKSFSIVFDNIGNSPLTYCFTWIFFYFATMSLRMMIYRKRFRIIILLILSLVPAIISGIGVCNPTYYLSQTYYFADRFGSRGIDISYEVESKNGLGCSRRLIDTDPFRKALKHEANQIRVDRKKGLKPKKLIPFPEEINDY